MTTLDSDRVRYKEAVQAIDRGHWTEFKKIRSSLDAYPLAIYLDYSQLSHHLANIGPQEAREFLARGKDSPLPNRFLSVYLSNAGKHQRWSDFLEVMPEEPNRIELKCYYLRAKLAKGQTDIAFEGAARLWVEGKSQPKECDPLFVAWQRAGQLTDDVVWARMRNAFEAREGSLLRYVARKGSEKLKPWSDSLLAVYAHPDSLRKQMLPASSAYAADIASLGIAYLARYQPDKALQYWQEYQPQLAFTPAQQVKVETEIALRSLIAEEEAQKPWLEESLARLQDDKLVELRLRWALAEQDWKALASTLPLLSAEGRAKSGWRYWNAILQERQGSQELANEEFAQLAGERSFYSFLAADKLGKTYSFNFQRAPLRDVSGLETLPAVRRIEELYFHQNETLAHSEWYKVLEDANGAEQQQELGHMALQRGWHRMAIDAANTAQAWDALDLRFPMPYQDTFSSQAKKLKVPSTELMAIARRESAFFPQAQSPVGARGLMQLMPATGKQVAASLGVVQKASDLYSVDHNVLLGSTYYRQLLDRFDGNRVFALTAYNAGPHRVSRWRNERDKGLPVDVWIETIPYRETRDYVQAVLAYNVVFAHLMGDTHSLLTSQEQRATY